MKRILAIAGLTWKAAFRYRLFWVLAALLLGAVVVLPLLLKDDGTAQGFTQILLTYTLSAITGLLGIATLWLACGTLARDVEECQLQMVTTKPIHRWQIWVGKWVGLLALDALLLALSGAAVFFLMQYRASHLPADQQKILQEDIFVARASIKERPANLQPAIDRLIQQRLKGKELSPADEAEVRRLAAEQVKAQAQVVPPGYPRRWVIDLNSLPASVRSQPFQARIKFQTSDANNATTYATLWQVGAPNSSRTMRSEQILPANSFQEFQIPANMVGPDGKLTIDFVNPNEIAVLFTIEDGFELLYREGGFGLNFARGLGIIFCWLALLATIGLASASLFSFPVAAFVSLSILIIGLSSSTLSGAIDQGTIFNVDHETGKGAATALDMVLLPAFKGALTIIKLVEGFSPIDSLSSGRSITWTQLGLAVSQIIFLLGGIFAAFGIISFTRRELAAAQTNT